MMRESSKVRRLGSVIMVEDQGGSVLVSTGLGNIELSDTIISPGAVMDAMRQIDAHSQHLANDIRARLPAIMATADGQRFYGDWVTWFAAWTGWYSQNRSGFSFATQTAYLDGDLVAHIRQLVAEYNDFEGRYRSITGESPTYDPGPTDSNSWLGLPVAAWVGIGAGVVGLGFLAWTANSVSRFAPATRALRGRRRR